MRIYISVDMEGIAGVVLPEQLQRGTAEYAEARRLLVAEANAAVEGARAGGADEVVVADMHGSGFNFPPEELHPEALWLHGGPHWPRFPYLEGSAGMILLGYHAMAGTAQAVRDHTMSSAAWQELRINGALAGEIAIDAALAGALGVPVILVTGDDKACAEARALLPGVLTAEVKRGVARHRALTQAPAAARALIRAQAAEAVRQATNRRAYRIEGPVMLRLTYTGADLADARFFDGRTWARVDGRTVTITAEDIVTALGYLLAR